MYTISVVRTIDAMVAMRDQWNELWSNAAHRTPYQSWEWNYSWIENSGHDDSLHVLVVTDGSARVVAIAPMYASFDLFSVRILSFIGDQATAYPDFLLHRDAPEELLLQMIGHLEGAADCSGVELKLTEPSPALGATRNALRASGWRRTSEERYTTRLRTYLGDDYDAYFATLSPKMRASIKVDNRKLEKRFQVEFRVCAEDELEQGLSEVLRLNCLKWGGDPSAFSRYRQYYLRTHESGRCMVFLLLCDGKAVGGGTASLLDGTVYQEIAGYDYSICNVGLGKVMISRLIRWAIDSGFRYLDWMTGTHQYKYRYRPEELAKWKVAAYKSGAARAIVVNVRAAREGAERMKQWLAQSELNRDGRLKRLVERFRHGGPF